MGALLWVMSGGALGAGGRYLLSQALLQRTDSTFPWATLLANISGALLMGLLVGYLARGSSSLAVGLASGGAARLFFGIGLLGGFTTFSTFSIEFWILVERGQTAQAFGYCLASAIGAIAACGVGLLAMRLSVS